MLEKAWRIPRPLGRPPNVKAHVAGLKVLQQKTLAYPVCDAA